MDIPGGARSWILKIIIGLLLLLNGFLIYLLLDRLFPPGRIKIERPIRVEVLNGCGAQGLALKMARYLRDNGFDVMNVGNAESFNIYRSMVIDRVGKLPLAERTAQAIGLNSENIIQQRNEDSVWHVTIVIGRDYRKLRPFNLKES